MIIRWPTLATVPLIKIMTTMPTRLHHQHWRSVDHASLDVGNYATNYGNM
jgi:hypothetical protein